MKNNDDISIFTVVTEKGDDYDDYMVEATVIKNGNSFVAHAEGSGLERTEDNAIQRAMLLAGLEIPNKL